MLPGLDRFGTFLATDFAFPFGAPERVVATVYDLTTITHPETHSLLTRLNARISLSLLRARQHRKAKVRGGVQATPVNRAIETGSVPAY